VGTIRGTVFDDKNGDGARDIGEPGMEGVTVTLLHEGATFNTTMTAGDGTYAFTPLFLGDYTVQETDPEGYDSTTANDVDISITAPGQDKTIDFGDRGIGAIQGIVFDDEDGDGAQDVGETGIEGATVALLSGGSVVETTTTAGGGVYVFDPAWLDDYTVRETDLSGYISTTPNEVTVSLTMTKQVEIVDFGDRGVGTIQGTVFDDRNGDGTQDVEEPGIEGVTLTLLQGGSSISTATSGGDGTYAFANLLLGDYTVRETNLDRYVSTTDDEVALSLATPGQQRIVNFGDRIPFIYLPMVARGHP
jgi:uncharacterized surface anchored protein